MGKKTLLWSTDRFSVGGAASYMIRMFQWANDRNYRSVLIVHENEIIDNTWEKQLKEYKVEVYLRKENSLLSLPQNKSGEKLFFEKNEKVLGFSTFIREFANLRYLEMHFRQTKFRNYFYVLHPWAIRAWDDNRELKKLYKALIYKDICNNNQLLFMDNECKNYFEEYYRLKSKTDIIPLGLHIEKLDKNIIYEREKKRRKNFTILTMGRLDFPMKEYILGAIDTYTILKEKYKNIQLKIIGYGKDENKVKQKINELEEEKRKDVVLIGKVPYNELGVYLDNASVLIAEGTCILDAAKRGLIGSVAYGYQSERKSAGLFHEEKTIGAIYNKELKSYYEETLIEQVYHMDSKEYIENSKKTYGIYCEEYDLNKIISKVIRLKTKRKSISNYIKLICFTILCRVVEY